jgi:phosphonate transport system substrate-binding protein
VNGQPASVFVASDYVGVVTALENSQVDIAYLNPLSYAIAAARAEKAGKPLIPIAMPYVIPPHQKKGSLTYEGIIFTRVDSGIHSLKDLKGKTFAFNEPTSTSGYLYPAALFLKAGINPKPMSEGGDLKDAHFAGAQGVVPSVLNGQSDAGAIYDEGIDISLPNPADRAKLRVIARTDPIPNGMLVARADMPHAEVVKLQKAFQTINTDPAGRASLAKMDVEKWVPDEDWLFNPVRKTAAILGLKLPAAKKS